MGTDAGGSFPDLDAIAERWLAHWDMTQRLQGNIDPATRLDTSLAAFIAQELEEDGGEHDRRLLIGLTLAAVQRSGAHSKPFLQAAIERISSGGQGEQPTRLNKRQAAVLWGTWAALVLLWRFGFGNGGDDAAAVVLAVGLPGLGICALHLWRIASR